MLAHVKGPELAKASEAGHPILFYTKIPGACYEDGMASQETGLPGLRQFRAEGCLSYVFHDPVSREAALIDPQMNLVAEYREYLVANRLRAVIALDTHTHADHFSASHRIRAELGSEIGMSGLTRSERPTRRLADGERIRIGSLELETRYTPGHTPDSVCFFAPAGPGLLFSGDTLFIGCTARTDFPGADAGQYWDSIQRLLSTLPGATALLPGHDYADLLFSTLEVERRKNPQLKLPREEFIRLKRDESIPTEDREVRRRIEFNLAANPTEAIEGASHATACGVARQGGDAIASINVEKYSHKLEKRAPDMAFVDVRDPEEYAESHIPGTVNLPAASLALHYTELLRQKRVYFSCLTGGRSLRASKTLNYLEHPDVVNVTGGFKAWINAGLPKTGGKSGA
jgi:glyoxylase-like metal-dependent hydrolase (beta-lactamase superfamily II)/rhodanese-related sulfurtransferase